MLEFKLQLKISFIYFWILMKKLLSLTAVALPLSISLSANAQSPTPPAAPVWLAQLITPSFPARPAVLVRPAGPARAALPARPATLVKAKPAPRLDDLNTPIEPIMADPAKAAPQISKSSHSQPIDTLGDLVSTLAARHPQAALARPLVTDPLDDLTTPLDDLARPLAANSQVYPVRPMADLAKPVSADPLGDLARVLDTPAMLEPVQPTSIDPLGDLAKKQAQAYR